MPLPRLGGDDDGGGESWKKFVLVVADAVAAVSVAAAVLCEPEQNLGNRGIRHRCKPCRDNPAAATDPFSFFFLFFEKG